MKKNKKIKSMEPVMPIIETHNKPTVGEFIEFLKTFPQDAVITLNGETNVSGYNNVYSEPEDNYTTRQNYAPVDEACECDFLPEYTTCVDAVKEEYLNTVDHEFKYGYKDNHDLIKDMRTATADELLNTPIMYPNANELEYEVMEYFDVDPNMYIDEIRQHNVYVAECMAEMHRREIAALLEYNTQVLAHFGIGVMKTMCEIVNKDK